MLKLCEDLFRNKSVKKRNSISISFSLFSEIINKKTLDVYINKERKDDRRKRHPLCEFSEPLKINKLRWLCLGYQFSRRKR